MGQRLYGGGLSLVRQLDILASQTPIDRVMQEAFSYTAYGQRVGVLQGREHATKCERGRASYVLRSRDNKGVRSRPSKVIVRLRMK